MNPRLFKFALMGVLFVSFLLLVLASLSVPIIKTITMLVATNDSDTFTIGLYGACLETSSNTQCTSSSIPFALSSLESIPGGQTTRAIMSGSLPYGLVLHPIAAVLVLVAALLSFSSKLSIQSMAFFLSLFCTFLVLVSFIIDLWLFVQVRAVIQATTSMSPALGGGLWLVFASLLLLVLAVFLGLKVRRLGKDI